MRRRSCSTSAAERRRASPAMKHRRGLLLAALLPATAAAQATAPARGLSALSRDLQALSERVKPAVGQVLGTGYAPADRQLVQQRATRPGVNHDPRGCVN